jgi:hypothetical protein
MSDPISQLFTFFFGTNIGWMLLLVVAVAVGTSVIFPRRRGRARRPAKVGHRKETAPHPQSFPNDLEPLAYRARDDFLSPGEISFFHVLCSVVGPDHFVFAKVRLSDILFVARPDENLAQYNQINQKHIDFLVCRLDGMRPVVAVELDDSSHQREDRQARDEFVDRAFEAADLRLVRVRAQRQYNTRGLAADLGLADPPARALPQTLDPPTPPLCPKCGVPMVQRIAANGTRRGEGFWGCVNFPRCREIRALKWKPSQA